jgi:pSer/pThr/pTyr-binding forkhead associated (FHA) protein
MSAKFQPLTYHLREAAGLTFSRFLEVHNQPVLLWAQSLHWAERIEPQFETSEQEYNNDQPLKPTAETESQVAGTLVIEIRKQANRGPSNTVFIGRAANNDIIFPEKAVSKLHAYFLKPETGDSYELVDADSTNGTRVNNLRLTSYQNQPLNNQDRIDFGPSIQTIYMTTRGFYDFLHHLHRSGIT